MSLPLNLICHHGGGCADPNIMGSILTGTDIWMEALDEAVGGTVGCVISGALVTAAALLACTRSLQLTCAMVLGVVAVLICFVGYLTQRGYVMGVVEAIATAIFIGFACDYAVHCAQVQCAHHGHEDDHHRSESPVVHSNTEPVRVEVVDKQAGSSLARALCHAGPSLYSAALTTLSAAAPLLFTRIVIFRQLGEFLVVCTVFSFFIALTFIAPLIDASVSCQAHCQGRWQDCRPASLSSQNRAPPSGSAGDGASPRGSPRWACEARLQRTTGSDGCSVEVTAPNGRPGFTRRTPESGAAPGIVELSAVLYSPRELTVMIV